MEERSKNISKIFNIITFCKIFLKKEEYGREIQKYLQNIKVLEWNKFQKYLIL